MDIFIRLIEAIAKLVAAFAWPAVVLFLIWWFGDALKQFLSNISEGSFKAFGFEGTAKRRVQEAIVSADLFKQETDGKRTVQLSRSVGKSLRAADYAVGLLKLHGRPTPSRRLLWVDDQPTNNLLEAKAFEELGFAVDFVVSTDEALHDIAKSRYDAIISDMARPGDGEAGKTLIRKLREMGSEIPVIVYSSNESPQFASELRDAGAFAATNLASELISRVAEAVDAGTSLAKPIAAYRYRHLRSSS
jgi:CheY-like chemotaxis protein